MPVPMRVVLIALFLCPGTLSTGWAGESPCRRYLVDGRVHVSLVFRDDGQAGELSWLDTVSGRRGDAPFEAAAPSLLHLEMPGGWCAPVRLLPDVALLFQPPPWAPATEHVALGFSLD